LREGTPSATAQRVAERRAAHQLIDQPQIFVDPLALRIVGADDPLQRNPRAFSTSRTANLLRAFFAVRSRFAEDQVAEAVARGVGQYVVLGAGLDTFAYRSPFASRLRVFEVDHPATQAWKKDMLQRAAIEVPPWLTFAQVDFERTSTLEGLRQAGFDEQAPAFFSWLGVTMYLARETVMATFAMIGALPAGSGVAFDYGVSRSLMGPLERLAFDAFAQRVAAVGEPWTTFFYPRELEADLRSRGFKTVQDLDGDDINACYFSDRSDGLKVSRLARLLVALT